MNELAAYYATRFNNGHRLTAKDSKRIQCSCGKPATHCEHSKWKATIGRGISFWYYCPECWVTPGPSGSSPEQRANKPQGATSQ